MNYFTAIAIRERLGPKPTVSRWNGNQSSKIDDLDFYIGDEALSAGVANYSVKVSLKLI